MGLLPTHLFCHGRNFFIEGAAALPYAQPPFTVHANYMRGSEEKRHRFREHLLWHVRLAPAPQSLLFPLFIGALHCSEDLLAYDSFANG